MERPPYYISAYSIARKHGYTGTEEEWLESLKASLPTAPAENGTYVLTCTVSNDGVVLAWTAQ